MHHGRIEHVNLTVTDPDRSAAFFSALFGWHERWRGEAMNGGETIHMGEEYSYLALYTDRGNHAGQEKGRPLNHVGLLVDDLEEAERIVIAHGLEPFGHDDYDPGRRFYFLDWDGIEFEIVNYG
ncbi:catechol 2,3-dioxygenase-like lactoylglutathione lyase family enzyme [Altererythrobacter atlanticus]|uniref:Glyoxalase-like domain protein n=1 Tax=Croceibacterium atlanticum TaxID=1267766 RepID=A0A0F7KU29_9SPHN|nr:VOC family protein [Croceibacterium atlanticum]AKH42290.1 Glyoxalase-like domain protein [Croceibacterium atlanticum]MBB5731067.1 catechol 2,3-dioxygenase-like lactoylglutathione lyase family enzyme [Croceibacterium atlanticum]